LTLSWLLVHALAILAAMLMQWQRRNSNITKQERIGINTMDTMNATKTVSPCADCDFLHKPKNTDICAGCDRRMAYWHSISGECYHIDTTSIRRISEITGLVHVGGHKPHKERKYRNGINDDTKAKISALYRHGLSLTSIANRLGLTKGCVNQYLYSKRYSVLAMDDRRERLRNGGTLMPDTIKVIKTSAIGATVADGVKVVE